MSRPHHFPRLTAFPSQSLWPPYPVRIRLASVACCDVTGHDGRLPWAPKSQAHLNARQSHLPPFILPIDECAALGVLNFDGFCHLAFRGISSIHSSNLHLIVLQLCSLSMSLFTVHYKRALFILFHNNLHTFSTVVENQQLSSKSIGHSSWLPALLMWMCQYPSSVGRHMLLLVVLCLADHGWVPIG